MNTEDKNLKEATANDPVSEESAKEEYSFIREKRKERVPSKKKVAFIVAAVAIMAVLFGLVSALVFVKVIKKIDPDSEVKADKVTFTESDDEDSEADQDGADRSDAQGSEADPDAPEETLEVIYQQVPLEPKDYEELYGKLNTIATEAGKSLVTVINATSEIDWFKRELENVENVSGVIVADNRVEYLILTDYTTVKGDGKISVSFADGTTYEGTVKAYDGATNLAIVSVRKANVSLDTRKEIAIATLGNSRIVKNGAPVIAAGSPTNYNNEAMFGNVTSIGNIVHIPDGNYEVLTTDILGAANGTGVLLNLKGEVIGVIAQQHRNPDSPNTLIAYGISDLKQLIEKMSNNGVVGYMGVRGTDVDEATAEAYGIPEGVFLQVEMDSPAMAAGLQNGDVLTQINNSPVYTMKQLQTIILAFAPEQALNVTFMRQGKEEYVEMRTVVTLSQLP